MENAQLCLLEVVSKTAINTVLILLSSNANSAARLPNGFVGVTHIFANHVTKDNATEITYLESRETNFQNAIQKNVLSR